jgi:hypothetical protein
MKNVFKFVISEVKTVVRDYFIPTWLWRKVGFFKLFLSFAFLAISGELFYFMWLGDNFCWWGIALASFYLLYALYLPFSSAKLTKSP